MRVIDQQVTDECRDIGGVFYPLTQRVDDRLKIERRDCVAVMCRSTQCPQHEVQAIGHTVTAHFALMELNLSKDCVHLFSGNAIVGDALNTGHHFALEVIGLCRFAALDAAAEDHLAHRFLKTAQWGRGCTPVSRF